jgi:hypothetical protein
MAESLLVECLTMTGALMGPRYGLAMAPVALDRMLRRAMLQKTLDSRTESVPSFAQAIPAKEGEADVDSDQL